MQSLDEFFRVPAPVGVMIADEGAALGAQVWVVGHRQDPAAAGAVSSGITMSSMCTYSARPASTPVSASATYSVIRVSGSWYRATTKTSTRSVSTLTPGTVRPGR